MLIYANKFIFYDIKIIVIDDGVSNLDKCPTAMDFEEYYEDNDEVGE